jgi:alpha-L-fucosidase 2
MGVVQAVIEMLLQSHDGEILLLPALPESWEAGSFQGLVARGNVVVDAWWENCQLSRARLTPRVELDAVLVTGPGYCLTTEEGVVLQDAGGRFQVRLSHDQTYLIQRKEVHQPC